MGRGQGRSGEQYVRGLEGLAALLNIPVFNADEVVLSVRPLSQGFRYRDGPMLSSGAPNPHVKVRLPFRLIAGEEEREQVGVAGYEFLGLGCSKNIISNSGVSTVLLPEVLHKMGISQEADIHHEIAIEGNSVFKPKREEVYPHTRAPDRAE